MAKIFSDASADYLCVNKLNSVEKIRKKGISTPILIMGYILKNDLKKAVRLRADLTVYNLDTIKFLGKLGKPIKVHLKIETGSNRQGVLLKDLPEILGQIIKHKNIRLVGVSPQFANLERRLHPKFAFSQLDIFEKAILIIKKLVLILNIYTAQILPQHLQCRMPDLIL